MNHDKCKPHSSGKLFRDIELKFNKTFNKFRGPHQPNNVFIPTGNDRMSFPRSVSSSGRMTNGVLVPHHSDGLNNSGFAHPGIQPSSSGAAPPPYPVQQPPTPAHLTAANVGYRRGSSPSSSTSTGSSMNGFTTVETPLTLRAQKDNLQMTRKSLEKNSLELDSVRGNIDDLNDYLAEKLSELEASGESLEIDSLPFDVVNAQIASLRDEIEVLRRQARDPSIFPPDRPPKPSSGDASWNCAKCSERNGENIYQCKRCNFSRIFSRESFSINEVNPVEMIKCKDKKNKIKCDVCSTAAADLLCVSSCPGDDEWLLVNKFNSPISY